jgi:trk system potassium uptake protein TrkH
MNAPFQYAQARPEWIVVRAFAAIILAGTLLLLLPAANTQGAWTPPLTALFTATSAACVTGLSVVDIGTYYSPLGQWIILALIQFGGLGIMTFGTFLLVLVGRRLGLNDEFVLMDSLGYDRIRGLPSLMRRALLFTIGLELLGTAVLTTRLVVHHGQPFAPALYSGFFHSVSAFCNAGFSIYRDNLAGFSRDPVFLLTIAGLIVAGGLGFLVLHDLISIRFWRRDRLARGRLSLHTRIVLKASGILLLVGWLVFGIAEWHGTLAPLGVLDRLTVAFFHSVTPRTAGFNVVDLAHVHPTALLLTMVLMFIGGSPCSTAGGVKTTTIAVLMRVMLAMIRGKREVETHGRTVPDQTVREALAIFVLFLVTALMAFSLLLAAESPPVLDRAFSQADELLFETLSAFGTVGLSMGITPSLSPMGQTIVILIMFAGRVGPLTLALLIGKKEVRQVIRYPEEEVVVG